MYPFADARNSQNHSVYSVSHGDTLTKIAKQRKGVTVADLAWLNGLEAGAPLRIGQSINVPHQAFLDAGREAKNKFLALDYYLQTHQGRLPPNAARPPSLAQQFSDPVNWRRTDKNGYQFYIDPIGRTRQVTGPIVGGPFQQRSRASQANAGGADRLARDHGGHYIARRFNGPTEAFNHFAQNGNFNVGRYKALENFWEKDRKAGKKDLCENYSSVRRHVFAASDN